MNHWVLSDDGTFQGRNKWVDRVDNVQGPRGLEVKEGNVLFNDALNTFYLRLYGVRHMVKDHSDSEKGNPLSPHRLLLSINSKGSFICTIPPVDVRHFESHMSHLSQIQIISASTSFNNPGQKDIDIRHQTNNGKEISFVFGVFAYKLGWLQSCNLFAFFKVTRSTQNKWPMYCPWQRDYHDFLLKYLGFGVAGNGIVSRAGPEPFSECVT